MTRIVVGVDGSHHSQRALRRAIEEAALRNGRVDAVYVYSQPRRGFSDDLASVPFGGVAGTEGIATEDRTHHELSRAEEAFTQAHRQLEQFVEAGAADVDGPRPELFPVAAAHPAEALIDQSETADLLVIGTRGRGGFRGALLGSVAHQCIQHSKCPVLVLPPDAD